MTTITDLTISIPTYNRNQTLNATLRAFLPYLPAGIVIQIIDNCSDIPVAETAAEVLAEFPEARIQLTRNAANVGGSANVMRCVELCTTTWLWILGDEDTPSPESFQIIHETLSEDTIFAHFSAKESFVRTNEVFGYGVGEFIRNMDSFSAVLFISSAIVNARMLNKYIRFGYHFSYSLAPHLATIFSAMKPSHRWVYSSHTIVTRGHPKDASQAFSLIPVASGLPCLEEIDNISPYRRELRKALFSTYKDWLQPPHLVFELLISFHQRRESYPLGRYMDLRKRLCRSRFFTLFNFYYIICAIALVSPRTTIRIIPMALKALGKQRALAQLEIDRSLRT